MQPATIDLILTELQNHFKMSADCEITLEANPGSVERQKFKDFRQAGINRLSLGIQALDDQILAFLGRRHSVAEALSALSVAQENFPRYSFDLIYARPDQTESEWIRELNQALSHAGDHLSLYQLTIEAGTAFFSAVKRGDWTPLPDDHAADLYDVTRDHLLARGWQDYEISNYARPDGESRHNLAYWRYLPYLGIGPGAHGRRHVAGDIFETTQIRTPEAWLRSVQEQGHGYRHQALIPPAQRVAEYIMMGLRLKTGIDLSYVQQLGQDPDLGRWLDMNRIDWLIAQDLLQKQDMTLRATDEGRLCLNALLPEIMSDEIVSETA